MVSPIRERHTNYSVSIRIQLHSQIMEKAVYRSMKGTLQRRYTMQRLHLFEDSNVPKDIWENISNQIRPVRPVPVRLDHIDEETVNNFPKIMDYPKEYVLK